MKRIAGWMFGILLGLGVVATPASAEIFVPDADNRVFFFNFENLFDANGDLKAPSAAPVVGDHLAGIISVQNILVQGNPSHYLQSATDQLSGVFAQKILEVKVDGFGITHLTLGNPTVGSFCSGIDCFSTGLAPGEMFAFYHQIGGGTTIFESNGTMADDVTKATDGGLFMTFGLDATNGAGLDGVFGTFDDTGYAYSHPILGANPEGDAFGGLDIKTNNSGFLFAGINDINECEIGGTPGEPGVGCAVTRPAPLLSGLVFTSEFEINPDFSTFSPWAFASNDPATLHPLGVIPEPSSMWLLGMGLSGLGVFGRRKLWS